MLNDHGIWKVFLINQYGSAGDVYWTFPKGHPEDNESPKEAALREFREETGIATCELIEDKTYAHRYSFMYEDTCINKSVRYYLGMVSSSEFSIQEDEVKEAGWFTLDEAKALLTYEYAKEVIDDLRQEFA